MKINWIDWWFSIVNKYWNYIWMEKIWWLLKSASIELFARATRESIFAKVFNFSEIRFGNFSNQKVSFPQTHYKFTQISFQIQKVLCLCYPFNDSFLKCFWLDLNTLQKRLNVISIEQISLFFCLYQWRKRIAFRRLS